MKVERLKFIKLKTWKDGRIEVEIDTPKGYKRNIAFSGKFTSSVSFEKID